MKKFLFSAIVAMVLIPSVALISSAHASVVLEKIVVKGNGRLSDIAVKAMISYREGDTISKDDEKNVLQQLFSTKSFQSVSAELKGSTLFITVKENPTINDFIFQGNKAIKTETLKQFVGLKILSYYNEGDLATARTNILGLYKKRGFYKTRVVITPQLKSNNRVNLVFRIIEGSITKIKNISFVGNMSFSSSALKDVILSKESTWWRFLSDDDIYDEARVAADKNLLKNFYRNRGFLDMDVLSVNADLSNDKRSFYLKYKIKEGKRFILGRIFVDNSAVNYALNMRELNKKLVGGQRNGYYYAKGLQGIVVNLSKELIRQGYLFVNIVPKVSRTVNDKGQGVVNVSFNLVEAKHIFVERIVIRGNVRTLDSVIRREMDVAEGDPFNILLMRNSEKNIRDLNFFSTVNLSFEKGSSDEKVVIYVTVQEKSTGTLGFGAGYSNTDGALFKVYATEGNFRGKGQKLNVSVERAKRNINFAFGFTEPRFLGRKLAANISASQNTSDNGVVWSNTSTSSTGKTTPVPIPGTTPVPTPSTKPDEKTTSYKTRKNSIGGGLSYKLNRQWYQSIQTSYTRTNIYDVGAKVSNAVKQQAGITQSFNLSQKLTYSDLDNILNPTKGTRFSFSTALRGLFTENRNVFVEAKGAYFRPINENVSLALVGSAARLFTYGNVPLDDRLYLNTNYVRGFDRVGPRDKKTKDLLGGTTRLSLLGEVSFPIGLPKSMGITGALYASMAKLMGTPVQKDVVVEGEKELRASVGFGIKWASPIGAMRFDFSKILKKAPSDETSLFQFNIGFGLY